jgi:hypothetical protein
MGLVARRTLTLRSLVLIALSNASTKEGQAHWPGFPGVKSGFLVGYCSEDGCSGELHYPISSRSVFFSLPSATFTTLEYSIHTYISNSYVSSFPISFNVSNLIILNLFCGQQF